MLLGSALVPPHPVSQQPSRPPPSPPAPAGSASLGSDPSSPESGEIAGNSPRLPRSVPASSPSRRGSGASCPLSREPSSCLSAPKRPPLVPRVGMAQDLGYRHPRRPPCSPCCFLKDQPCFFFPRPGGREDLGTFVRLQAAFLGLAGWASFPRSWRGGQEARPGAGTQPGSSPVLAADRDARGSLKGPSSKFGSLISLLPPWSSTGVGLQGSQMS